MEDSIIAEVAKRMAEKIDADMGTLLSGTCATPPPESITAEQLIANLREVMTRIPAPPPRIRESRLLVDYVEDWSDVRSPSRAARRRKQGHPQNIRVVAVPKQEGYQIGNYIFVHPDALAAALARQS